MQVDTLTVRLKVKITLWSAIKLRIAGLKNVGDMVELEREDDENG